MVHSSIERIFLCDIGNTAIKFGVADAHALLATYSLPTRRDATTDSIGSEILVLLDHAKLLDAPFAAGVIASVCPALNAPIRAALKRYLSCDSLFVPDDLPVPLENRYKRPTEVGSDRLVGSWAAMQIYPGAASLIVVDFGTAVTLDCVEKNAYLGGLIVPGPITAMTALASNTAKLPQVSLELKDDTLRPCQDTATSISHGLLFGYAALVEGLCARLRRQLTPPTKILATGGFANTIGRLTSVFDTVVPGLLLTGLAGLYFGSQALTYASGPTTQRS